MSASHSAESVAVARRSAGPVRRTGAEVVRDLVARLRHDPVAAPSPRRALADEAALVPVTSLSPVAPA